MLQNALICSLEQLGTVTVLWYLLECGYEQSHSVVDESRCCNTNCLLKDRQLMYKVVSERVSGTSCFEFCAILDVFLAGLYTFSYLRWMMWMLCTFMHCNPESTTVIVPLSGSYWITCKVMSCVNCLPCQGVSQCALCSMRHRDHCCSGGKPLSLVISYCKACFIRP